MCGILGIVSTSGNKCSQPEINDCINQLFLLSESRGKEAAGAAFVAPDNVSVIKSGFAASRMIRHPEYKSAAASYFESMMNHAEQVRQAHAVIGHSRLVTTGDSSDHHNNQPIYAGGMVGIHNGIIVNHDDLWKNNPDLTRQNDVDSEIIFALTGAHVDKGDSPARALSAAFGEIQGAASVAAVHLDFSLLLLATNNGSLYWAHSPGSGIFVFCSEHYILDLLIRKTVLKQHLDPETIQHLLPGTGMQISLDDVSVQNFEFTDSKSPDAPPRHNRRTVNVHPLSGHSTEHRGKAHRSVGMSLQLNPEDIEEIKRIRNKYPHDTTWQDSLKRCSRCILPETMPFISFDEAGVCNYCRNYRKLEFRGRDALEKAVAPHRNKSDLPDCVVGISGGRDSMYMLHYVKTQLGMNPAAYTYDWGMVTDLARRNISRICGKLGIEHIIVSADIPRKRENIRKNIRAWLRRPSLGMIPLFMAGDKQYYSNLYRVQKQLNVNLAVLGENMLERTDFKTGFAGVRPYNLDSSHVYTLPLSARMKLIGFYLGQFLGNPLYINSSLADSASAYASYYLSPPSYLNLYNYIPWLEEEVIPTLINEYDFELAPDSNTTWRIGDGTAAFYNYIYFNVAGFTENETFRSNQIREGYITREKALEHVREENKPRFETIYWYLSIINMDLTMDEIIKTIHDIPRLKGRK